ncbi:MAG: vancomycin high temperature exclusion protein [Candidatus Promineifilaceae bacterium]
MTQINSDKYPTQLINAHSNTTTTATTRQNRVIKVLLAGFFVVLFLPWLWRHAVRFYYANQIHTIESAQPERVAIVFGAAVYRDGRLSAILRDRMDTAIELYQSGKVEKLLLSGDNSEDHYDEPGAMMAYAVARGVQASDIQPDFAGLRTYDTCYRARNIFEVQDAILVTQAFHLPRAIFTCRQLGIYATGVEADYRPYRGQRWYELRETVATARALLDVIRQAPAQIMGEPIPF